MEAKTYSVVRHPEGTYHLSIKSGGGWFCTSGFKDLARYVPAHLLPLFSDVVGPAPAADSPAPGRGTEIF